MIIKTIVLTVYFYILLGIGFFASRRIKNISDYYVGGKKLNYWIAALSARSTGESGWLLIGVTGMGALIGVSAMRIVVGEVIGVFFSWLYVCLAEGQDTYERWRHRMMQYLNPGPTNLAPMSADMWLVYAMNVSMSTPSVSF